MYVNVCLCVCVSVCMYMGFVLVCVYTCVRQPEKGRDCLELMVVELPCG